MLFVSEEFLLIFLPIVLAGYYAIHILTHNITAKNIWLLASSIVFYAWGEPVYVFLMLGFIVFNYVMAIVIDSGRLKGAGVKRLLFVLTLIVNISALIWFKYAGTIFARTSLSDMVSRIVLPIGISFYTFQAMSYVADVYTGKLKAEKNPMYVGLYISFFPQLIAGPIVRYEMVSDRIKDRKETYEDFGGGVERFITGVIKKVLIANRMAVVADAVWDLVIDGRLEASLPLAWLGAISYTLQIFFDFSGYSDMAIGLGAMFGFKLPENFDHPYVAKSITEFWRRWHITLSGWFKDYVYIPLGGSRVSRSRLIINLFIVWLLTGIWHGSNITFVVWGLIYFAVLVTEKLVGVKVNVTNGGNDANGGNGADGAGYILTDLVKRIYTLLTIILAWVVFRSDSLKDALAYIKGMFDIHVLNATAATAYLKQNIIFYIVAVILCIPIRRYLDGKSRKASPVVATVYNVLYGFVLAAGFILSVTYIFNNAYNPFIYFNF